MTEQQQNAIYLMIEDLYRTHSDARKNSKVLGCEQELNKIRDDVIKYLRSYQ
jgi:hypothetical protein